MPLAILSIVNVINGKFHYSTNSHDAIFSDNKKSFEPRWRGILHSNTCFMVPSIVILQCRINKWNSLHVVELQAHPNLEILHKMQNILAPNKLNYGIQFLLLNIKLFGTFLNRDSHAAYIIPVPYQLWITNHLISSDIFENRFKFSVLNIFVLPFYAPVMLPLECQGEIASTMIPLV